MNVSNQKRMTLSNISDVVHTDRSCSLDCIDLHVHAPSSTTIINHSFKSQRVVTQINYIGSRCGLLSADICTILGDIPCRGLCSRGKTGHLLCSWSKCPDIRIHGIARRKISILGSKLVGTWVSVCWVLKCGLPYRCGVYAWHKSRIIECQARTLDQLDGLPALRALNKVSCNVSELSDVKRLHSESSC